MTTQLTPSTSQAKAGKYLTFMLANEHYGIPALKVCEIIRLCAITAVPRMPDYVKGVINLRGKIIPVMDPRLKFRHSEIKNGERTCIVVVLVGSGTGIHRVGIIVDAVEEVVTLPQADIEPTPQFGASIDPSCILGM